MASTELYSSIAKPKKKYTFGQKLGDVGKLYADNMLSTLGASDVISDDAYKGEWAEKASGILSPIAGVVGQVALAAATGGTGNAALSAAKAVGPSIFAKGGKKTKTPQELTGPTIRGKKYPKGTIVTNDPNDPRLKAYQDSLYSYNTAIDIADGIATGIAKGYYNKNIKSQYYTKEEAQKHYKDDLKFYRKALLNPVKNPSKANLDYGNVANIEGDVYNYTDMFGYPVKGSVSNVMNEYSKWSNELLANKGDNIAVSGMASTTREDILNQQVQLKKYKSINKNIKPTNIVFNAELPPVLAYKNPVQPVVYQPFVNRMTPKGLPASTQPIPQMLHMPDRIEMDSRTGSEYKGIKVSHYTDALGRYTAKLNKTTTPGVQGRISTPYAMGGLRTFEGNTHEQGGIKLGNDEVEDSETMVNLSPDSDYIFSDRIIVPDTKQSFAAKSKRISKKYSLRPNDPYGKKSEELELKRLANEQEAVKSKSKSLTTNANHMAMGGKRYVNGGQFEFVPKVVDPLFQSNVSGIEDYKFGEEFNKLYNPSLVESKVTPLTSSSEIGVNEFDYGSSTEPSKSNFLIPALGYAAQAATNIPALLTKPETINSARVKFGKLNLAEQRNEARRSRNLALATAKGIGANDTGQMMNYLSGTTAALNSAYGNQFNQSLLAEQEANLETNMREQLANSEIERYDEQINAQERDAARSLRMNALQNLGTISAMTGKDYLSMQQTDDYLAALSAANPDYGLRGRTPYRKRAYGGTRKRAMGGKY